MHKCFVGEIIHVYNRFHFLCSPWKQLLFKIWCITNINLLTTKSHCSNIGQKRLDKYNDSLNTISITNKNFNSKKVYNLITIGYDEYIQYFLSTTNDILYHCGRVLYGPTSSQSNIFINKNYISWLIVKFFAYCHKSNLKCSGERLQINQTHRR